MAIHRMAVPPRTPTITLPSGPLPRLEGSADAVRDEVKEGKVGLVKVVTGGGTDNVVWDDNGIPEVEADSVVDIVFDAMKLDGEAPVVEIEPEGLPMVAAPGSKRADVVLQQRVHSSLDSQQ